VRILLIKFRNIGDVILSSALIENLRAHYPNSEIDYALNKECAPVLKYNPEINKLIFFDRSNIKKKGFYAEFSFAIKTIKYLRKRKYDLVINLTEGDRGALFTFLSNAKLKLGFSPSNKFLSRLNIYDFIGDDKLPIHTVEKDLQFIPLLGKKIYSKKNKIFWHHDSEITLEKKIINSDKRIVVIHPVSRWMFKCWNDKSMAKVIDFLQEEKDYKVFVTCSSEKNEIIRVNKIINLCKLKPYNLSGKLNLNELSCLIHKADLFFGIDSAPMHIAAACNTTVVAIFGASYPTKWGPWYDGTRNFQNINGYQNNGKHHIFSNINHEIFYEDEVKKSKGMDLIELEQVKTLLREIL